MADMTVKEDDNDRGSNHTGSNADGAQTTGFKAYARIFQYASNTARALYAVAAVSAVASGVTLPLMNIVFGRFVTAFNNFAVGQLSPDRYMDQVSSLALYFIYLFIAKFFLTYIHTVAVSLAAIATTKALRLHFLQSLLRQDMGFFDSKNTGSPSIKVTTNGNQVNNGISDKLSQTIASIATFVAAFAVAFAIQWKLTLITICIVPVVIIVTVLCFVFDAPVEAKVNSYYSQAGMLAEEVFSTITTVQAFWLQPLMAKRYDDLLVQAQKEGMKKSIIYGFLFSGQFFCVYSGYALAFWQGIRMYVSGEIDEPGKIVTVIFALVLAATSLQTIAIQVMNVTQASSAASELFAVIDRESPIDPESDAGLAPKQCDGHIEVRDVDFAYPSRPDSQVLNGLTLEIPAKKTTALVGASGSGKSTIVGLLDRWYDQTGGSITLDGVEIRQLNVRWLRTRIGLVQQEAALFSGTVFENVAHGLTGSTHETGSEESRLTLVQEACKAAFAHDFIEELPQKYFTQIGERAGTLSGGQRQRIAIARSIISDPAILLLDEATSALDPQAEKIVQEALDNVSKSRTTLVIAHKLSTIQKADNIAVMSQGAVVEQGTHQELLTRNGAYGRLVRAQSLEQAQHEDDGHGTRSDGQGYDQSDGDDGAKKELVRSKTNQSGDPDAEQDVGEEEKEEMGYSLVKCLFILVREQRRWWPLYAVLALESTLAGGTWPSIAVLFSRMFGTFQLQGSEARSEGNFWALMFFVVAIGNLIVYFSIGITTNNIVQRVTRRYRLETFNNTIKQDISFFHQSQNATGAITSRLSTCATDMHELLGLNSGLILNNLVTVVACAILGIAYGWKLGLVCTFGALPPMLVSGYARIRIETKLEGDTQRRFASSAALAAEAVAAIRTVASLTLESTILDEYRERLSSVASKSARALLTTMLWYSLSQSINFLAMALGFWYGGKLVSTGEYTTTQFFVVFIAVILGGENAAQLFQYTSSITKAGRAANYIFWLRNRVPAIPTDDNDEQSPGIEKDGERPTSVDCNAISFAYPSRPHVNVIKSIDVSVPAGKFIAFCGPSGCGKSTLISLLARFYDPTSGVIKMNDQPINFLSPRAHRNRLALVQQEPVLYSGSIRDNVAMGVASTAATGTEPSESEIENALHSANVLDFVRSLPEGLHTPLGQRGTQLSGGQRQRIAISRALIRNPSLLLLDEATSALDTESEKVVQTALMDAAGDGTRTTIAVAHRLSTIKDADEIFVFRAGRIVESGSHGGLIERRGVYFEMCEGQALDREA